MKTTIIEKANSLKAMNQKLIEMIVEHEGTHLEVKHDRYPENEILINADSWCDIGSHKVPEWNMQNVLGDAAVCADCYEQYN